MSMLGLSLEYSAGLLVQNAGQEVNIVPDKNPSLSDWIRNLTLTLKTIFQVENPQHEGET
jgi:hypothetical protein